MSALEARPISDRAYVAATRRATSDVTPLAVGGTETVAVAPGIVARIGRANGRVGKAGDDHIVFTLDDRGAIASVRLPRRSRDRGRVGEWHLDLALSAGILSRFCPQHRSLRRDRRFHLPPRLRGSLAAIRHADRHDALRQLHLAGKCLDLLVGLLRSDPAELVPTTATLRLSRSDSARLVHARRLIHERANEHPTIDAIARAVGMNRCKLTSACRDVYGRSVGELLADTRFAAAAIDLLSTDDQIDRIAYRVGYEGAASFARGFARHFAITPGRFRAQGGEL